jgi:hypothetical protein
MKKNPCKQSRDKVAPVKDKDLASVKGSSGYYVTSGREGDPPPDGGG